MARTRSMTSIDAEISKVENELSKLQEKQDVLIAQLTELQKLKQEFETKQVMDAFRKSGKSLQELKLRFLSFRNHDFEPQEYSFMEVVSATYMQCSDTNKTEHP